MIRKIIFANYFSEFIHQANFYLICSAQKQIVIQFVNNVPDEEEYNDILNVDSHICSRIMSMILGTLTENVKNKCGDSDLCPTENELILPNIPWSQST